MDYNTLPRAQKVLQKPRLAKSSFDKFPVKVLQKLCENNAIDVAGTGKRQRKLKADYIRAIFASRGIRVNVGEGGGGGNPAQSNGLESQ